MPAHWDVVQLGRIGKFSKGAGGTKSDEVSAGVPCVRYGDLYTSHKYFIRNTRSFIPEEKAPNYTRIKYGDILFAGSGETIEEIGKSAVNLIESQVCCGGDVILFRPDVEMNATFSGYVLDSPQAQHQKARMGRGITIMHIYSSQLKYLYIGFPPLPEQAAIVEYLDKATANIDAAIAPRAPPYRAAGRVPNPPDCRRSHRQAGRSRRGGESAGRILMRQRYSQNDANPENQIDPGQAT